MQEVREKILDLKRFASSFKGKDPEYVLMSEDLFNDLCFELMAVCVCSYANMKVIHSPFVAKDFICVGYGNHE